MTATAMAEIEPTGPPFQEAIDFLRQKVDVPTASWTDLWQGQHARAFVVAGAMKAELVADLRAAVDRALAEGRTLADFRRDFDAIVARHGWTYKGGRNWRTRVIYATNLRMAHAEGRWEQAQAMKERRPYMRYVAILDHRTRDDHRGWHGTVLPIENDWWRTHYPPNGWGCRCYVRTLGPRDLERHGYTVSDQAPPVTWINKPLRLPGGGEVPVPTPEGIDLGFAYNVGVAGSGYGEMRIAMERHGGWEPLEAPGGSRPAVLAHLDAVTPKASLGPRARPGDAEDLRRRWRDAVGADAVILTDPAGHRVQLGPAIVDHMLEDPKRQDGREAVFPLLPELIEEPQEIWVGFQTSKATGRVAVRRRYIRLVRIGKDRVVALVADQDGGVWSGVTAFPAKPPYLARLRQGLRVHPTAGAADES